MWAGDCHAVFFTRVQQEVSSFSTDLWPLILGVLFLVYVCNFIDRQVLSILLDDIKRDLQVSDTAMGLLAGWLALRAGLPAGVLNVICGDRDTGRLVVEHPTPQMVSVRNSRSAVCSIVPRQAWASAWVGAAQTTGVSSPGSSRSCLGSPLADQNLIG